jgi:hypothetical protein
VFHLAWLDALKINCNNSICKINTEPLFFEMALGTHGSYIAQDEAAIKQRIVKH